MKLKIVRYWECDRFEGVAVVIDVLRAFTTAAFAFAAGAKKIIPVRTIEEAFAIRERHPDYLLMGEVGGLPIEGFDFGNSPSAFQKLSLKDKTIVQRTSAGTQGLLKASGAETVLAASFVVAGATLRRIQALQPHAVTFVITGSANGDEDAALAEYLMAQCQGERVDRQLFLDRVRHSPEGKTFSDPLIEAFPKADLDAAMALDRFDFSMELVKGRLIRRG